MASDTSIRESSSHEASVAKAALGRVIKETRTSLGTAVDVRLWTKKSPWIAVGLAAAAGMVTAVFIRRGSGHAAQTAETRGAVNLSANGSQPSAPAKSGMGAAIASSIFDLAKFGLETAIVNGMRNSASNNVPPVSNREKQLTRHDNLKGAEP